MVQISQFYLLFKPSFINICFQSFKYYPRDLWPYYTFDNIILLVYQKDNIMPLLMVIAIFNWWAIDRSNMPEMYYLMFKFALYVQDERLSQLILNITEKKKEKEKKIALFIILQIKYKKLRQGHKWGNEAFIYLFIYFLLNIYLFIYSRDQLILNITVKKIAYL